MKDTCRIGLNVIHISCIYMTFSPILYQIGVGTYNEIPTILMSNMYLTFHPVWIFYCVPPLICISCLTNERCVPTLICTSCIKKMNTVSLSSTWSVEVWERGLKDLSVFAVYCCHKYFYQSAARFMPGRLVLLFVWDLCLSCQYIMLHGHSRRPAIGWGDIPVEN